MECPGAPGGLKDSFTSIWKLWTWNQNCKIIVKFIDFEAAVDQQVGSEDEVSDVDSLKSFIDDIDDDDAQEEDDKTF